jgi:hypothetical protein
MQATKCLEERFLRAVACLFRVADGAQAEVVNGPVVPLDEQPEGVGAAA